MPTIRFRPRKGDGQLRSAGRGAGLLAAAILAMPALWIGTSLLNVWLEERALRDIEAAHIEQFEVWHNLRTVPAGEMPERLRSEKRWRAAQERRNETFQDRSLRAREFGGVTLLMPTDWRLVFVAILTILAGPLLAWLGMARLWQRARSGLSARLRREGSSLLCVSPLLLVAWSTWSARHHEHAVDLLPLIVSHVILLTVIATVATLRLAYFAKRARRALDSRVLRAARDLPYFAALSGTSFILLIAGFAPLWSRLMEGGIGTVTRNENLWLPLLLLTCSLTLTLHLLTSLWRLSIAFGRVRRPCREIA